MMPSDTYPHCKVQPWKPRGITSHAPLRRSIPPYVGRCAHVDGRTLRYPPGCWPRTRETNGLTVPDPPIELCRGFTTLQWRKLRPLLDDDDPEAWKCAIEVFRRRLSERYLSSIEALIRADNRFSSSFDSHADYHSQPQDDTHPVVPGFAITALCCLLIETLQSFREGSSRNTGEQFDRFLARPAFRGEFAGTHFTTDVRNKILHEAETRHWIIWRTNATGSIVEPLGNGRYVLYRNEFFDAIKHEFDAYLDALTSDGTLRAPFLRQMDKAVKGS